MKGIKLQVPRQDPSHTVSIDIRPEGLKQWLDSLPLTNTNEAVSQLLPVLKEVNHSQIKPALRHDFLLLVQPMVLDLARKIKKRYINVTLPLTPQIQVNVNTVRELHREMAFAYKLIIVELSHQERNQEENIILKNALYCAIRSLSRILLESYIVFENEPGTVWSELHLLYQFTEKNLSSFLKAPGISENRWTNPVINAYKRIVLLALANPYHLMQGEVNRIDQLLKTWSSNTLIHEFGHDNFLTGKFVIDLAADAPPRYMTASMKSCMPIDIRMIDTRNLHTKVKQQIEKFSRPVKFKNNITMLGHRQMRNMFVRLENTWHTRPERLFPRSTNLSKVIMSTGLSASHYFVSGEVAFNTRQENVSVTDTQSQHNINLWNQRSDSHGGLGLFCNHEQGAKINVGELVALKPVIASGENEWEVGVIRWLRSQPESFMHVGVKILSEGAISVATRGVKGTGKGNEYYRSLLLPNLDPREHPTTLITPAAVYDTGSIIAINMEDMLIYAKITRLVQSTNSFSQFQFKLTEAPAHTNKHAFSSQSDQLSVW
ncbi:MAG: hypothetical protein OEZ38_14595 [Gammaproteobacteria bacterium]|nr:hypothetical protein [Gammaproteobacteria bacterium]